MKGQKNTPLSPKEYCKYMLFYSIPFAGWIIRHIHKRKSENVNLRNFAASYAYIFWFRIIILLSIIGLMIALGFVDWLYSVLY